MQRDVPRLRWGREDVVQSICGACCRGCHGANGWPCFISGSRTFTVQGGRPLAGHRANGMCQPSSPVPHTSYRPQPRPLGSRRSHPTSYPRPALAPGTSPLRHSRPIVGSRAPERSDLCRGAAGKRGHGDAGGGERVLPASSCPVTVPGRAVSRQPRCPAVPWCLLPWCAGAASAGRALAPCPVAVSSRFLLSLFFFPPQHLPEERTGRRKHNFPL